ncbi:pro-opiomelanocortin-like [Dunckerocampus dactyliophorus]|uniref:pro-opiomelanocortin-like n=1 Tax=Dunckerocampus dactyliophorus TaxID=161453 RepID=UPI0024054F0E|nr:pro-opiomelanocortin-like [Dunckerocampus dactyliophorus]
MANKKHAVLGTPAVNDNARSRMCPAWLLVCVALAGVSRGTVGQCWDQSECQESDLAPDVMDCLHLSDPDDARLQPPPPRDSSSSPVAKRSYSMEHFCWGKPVGRKRRPIKVYTSSGVRDSAEVFPAEMRRDLTNELQAGAEEEVTEEQLLDMAQKKDGSYKMKHFRWSSPPASKRYGGFMKSWDPAEQVPLVTPLIKDAQVTHAHNHQCKYS